MIKHSLEISDPYAWERRTGAKKLGLPEAELADEPDTMADHADDQGYDDHDA